VQSTIKANNATLTFTSSFIVHPLVEAARSRVHEDSGRIEAARHPQFFFTVSLGNPPMVPVGSKRLPSIQTASAFLRT
jgi:hypothetical protein